MSHNNPHPFERTSTPIKVAVLSDDALLRNALATWLGQEDDVEVTPLDSADVALWDPGTDLASLEPKLVELRSLTTPTVALLSDADHAQRAINAGARGVILRDHVGPNLVSALQAVRGGLTVLDAPLADNLIAHGHDNAAGELVEELTAREKEVIQLMSEGLSNKQIAKRLEISEHTAKFHIGRILAKLDADTRTEAVVRALRFGLVML